MKQFENIAVIEWNPKYKQTANNAKQGTNYRPLNAKGTNESINSHKYDEKESVSKNKPMIYFNVSAGRGLYDDNYSISDYLKKFENKKIFSSSTKENQKDVRRAPNKKERGGKIITSFSHDCSLNSSQHENDGKHSLISDSESREQTIIRSFNPKKIESNNNNTSVDNKNCKNRKNNMRMGRNSKQRDGQYTFETSDNKIPNKISRSKSTNAEPKFVSKNVWNWRPDKEIKNQTIITNVLISE